MVKFSFQFVRHSCIIPWSRLSGDEWIWLLHAWVVRLFLLNDSLNLVNPERGASWRRYSISCRLLKILPHIMSRVSKLLTILPLAIKYFPGILMEQLSFSGAYSLSVEKAGEEWVVTLSQVNTLWASKIIPYFILTTSLFFTHIVVCKCIVTKRSALEKW